MGIRDRIKAAGHALIGASTHEAAESSRRLKNWPSTNQQLNTMIQGSGRTLLQRSRHLVNTNGYAINAKESFRANLVGAGIKASSLIEEVQERKQLHSVFKRWMAEADADGVTSFYGLQSLIAGALFDAGEVFVRLRNRRLSDRLSIPLQMQLIEAEQLDPSYTIKLPNGHLVRCGIEFDGTGNRVAYHFWRTHPNDATFQTSETRRVRVPAAHVLHIYEIERPGQIRGIPRTLRALTDLFHLDMYDEAELDRKKIAALFAGFITRPDNEESFANESEPDDDGIATANWRPGMMQMLLPGEDVKFSDPADVGANYELFQYRTLLRVSAALGIPYAALTNDMVKANYSNTRAALMEQRRRMAPLQQNILVHQFCRPVWRRFIDQALLAGAIQGDREALVAQVKWIAPKWDWVDPLKDRQAEALAVEHGFKSRSDVVEAEGYDPEEMDQRIADDHAREEELGLSFSPSANAGSDPVNTSEDEEEEFDAREGLIRRLAP